MSDFLNPKRVIENLSLREEMDVVDFGCGSGGWVIPIAKKIKNAKIYAVDILEAALSALKSNAEMERVYNIRTIRCDVERGTDLNSESMDLVIASNLFFQVDDKEAVVREAQRLLRREGELIVVDWKIKEDNAEERLHKIIEENNFKFIKKINVGESHFANLYEKI